MGLLLCELILVSLISDIMTKNTSNRKAVFFQLGFTLLINIIVSSSCKKLVETDPPSNKLSTAQVFSADASAIGVLNAMYAGMNGNPYQGNGSINLYAGLNADELTLYNAVTSASYLGHYKNALTSIYNGASNSGYENWRPLYGVIFSCNSAIEGLNASNTLTASVKQQLLGEAIFLRAFHFFYLVNLWGDVPLVLGTDPQENNNLSRSSKDKVYDQIIADLKNAEELLSNNFLGSDLLTSTLERVRPTKWAATALLARVYLYKGEWAKAEDRATALINNLGLFGPLPPLNNAFLKNSKEAIWQIQPTDVNFNTTEAQTFCLTSFGPNTSSNPVYLNNNFLSSFEPGDQRAVPGNWTNSITVGGTTYYFPFKYKLYQKLTTPVTSPGGLSEYFMVLRLGEQFLIRSEARAKLNNLSGAISDLDSIRKRAGLPLISVTNPGISQSALVDKILHERQVELFAEWGHRWLDLKRSGKVDEVMGIVTPQKSGGAPWKSYQQWYPIDYFELQRGPNLTQTAGY
jgi:hypothetical protein